MLLIVEWVTTSLMLLHVSFAFVRYVDGHVIQRVPTRVFCHRPTGLQKDATRALSATPTTIIDKFEPPAPLPSYCKKVIDIGLPEGRCLGFSVEDLPVTHPDSLAWEQISNNKDHWIRSLLHPDEVSFGLKEVGSTDVPISSFWVGRLAMRAALGFPDYPVLRDSYGRPSLKESIRGSISHKQGIGVALVAPCSDTTPCGIGVDLEVTSRPGKRSIATKILTQNELDGLGRIPNVSVDEEVLLRFSLKEAIYKAVHPLLCQYIGFREAEVTPHANGTATCDWFITSGAHKNLGTLTAHWRKLDDGQFFLTSASAQLKDSSTAMDGNQVASR